MPLRTAANPTAAPAGRRRSIRLRPALAAIAATLVAVPLGLATPAPAVADPVAAPGGAGPEPAAALPGLTLITGDQVRVEPGPDGDPVVQETIPAPWRERPVPFHTFARGGSTYVVPGDAGALLDAGVLDWNLFDVLELGKLAAAGRVGEVPVLIDHADDAATAGVTGAPGLAPGRELPEIDATASVVAGDGGWWQTVQAATGDAPAARVTSAGPLAGIDKVWLEPVYTVSLDESVPQVSAPVAWARGLDGTGVEVAVLDTGIDPDHPDVAGQIVEQVDFTGSPNGPRNGYGHGTHVAATIAGTGAAGGGLRPGVAPGATLRIGKVCNDGGTCPFEAIRDGMIWAAQSGVPVVNMSLGGGPTDGTDPLSRLVNSLSSQYSTLFVLSAGNNGPDPYTVGAPGAADAALTVAAVDKADEMASFSSRGPRVGDDAPKPDIAAPGVGIVAARAAGTSMGTPVDERYTSANGTSMAAPHVAGAAAIAAQKHPDLTGGQLKALLMSSAQDLGFMPEAQGAGRLDVGRAVDQAVFGDGPVSFGQLPYPHQQVTDTVVYQNATDQPLTLDLTTEFTRLSSESAPDGLLTLDAEQVTVPAQGEVGVTVTLDGRVLDGSDGYGRYQGAVHAYDADGELRVSSRITAFLEPPRRDVTVMVTPPEGASDVVAFLGFVAVDEDVAVHEDPVVLQVGPSTTLEVFDGTYEFIGTINWLDEQGRWREGLAPAPELVVDGQAVTFALDLRQAKPAYTRTPEPTQSHISSVRLQRVTGTGDWTHTATASTFYSAYHSGLLSLSQSELAPLVLPTAPVDTGTFTLASQEVRIPPPVTLRVVGGGEPLTLDPRYEVSSGVINNGSQQLGEQLVPNRSVISPIPQLPRGQARLVDAGRGTPEELAAVDVRGALVLLDLDRCNWSCSIWPSDSWLWDRLTALADQGAAGVLGYRSDQGRLSLGLTWPYRQYKCTDGWDSCPEPEPYSPLPIVTLPPGQDAELRERLDQDARLIGLAGGQQRVERAYALTHVDDHVPDQLPWQVGARDLERVEHRLLADGPGEVDLTWWPQYQGAAADLFLRVYMPRVPAQSTLSVYHIKDERGYRYSSRRLPYVAPTVVDGLGDNYEEGQQLRPGQATVDWSVPPLTPGPGVHTVQSGRYLPWNALTCAGCRQGDVLYPTLYRVSGDGGRAGLIGPLSDRTNLTERVFGEFACEPPQCTVHLYDDTGAELPQRLVPLLTMDVIGYDLPAEPGRYTLEVADSGVTTAWTYTSQRPAVDDEDLPVCMEDVMPGLGDEKPCQDESLPFLRYDLGELDLDTTMPAGTSTTVRISGYYQQEESAPEVTELALEVSYDGGGTWLPVPTSSAGDSTFTATLRHPRLADTNGSVGMRVTAHDDQGNSVVQTAPKVYGLR